jgi:hypothetical protein
VIKAQRRRWHRPRRVSCAAAQRQPAHAITTRRNSANNSLHHGSRIVTSLSFLYICLTSAMNVPVRHVTRVPGSSVTRPHLS